MEENKEKDLENEDNLNPKKCDIALKPKYTPPGASPSGFWDCDSETGEWFWNDPHVA